MKLQLLKQKLEAMPGILVSERGAGKAKFLYLRSSNRVIEVSEEGDDFFVEYWDSADEESDEASVKEELIRSEFEVLAKIRSWISRQPTA